MRTALHIPAQKRAIASTIILGDNWKIFEPPYDIVEIPITKANQIHNL